MVGVVKGGVNFFTTFGTDILFMIIALLILIIGPIRYVNRYCDVQISKNGIRVRIYGLVYKWKFISWDSILGVEKISVNDRWGRPIYIVIVKNLTILHRTFSLQYGKGMNPGIIISSDLSDYEELLWIIQENIR
jgi:hypothetical protein